MTTAAFTHFVFVDFENVPSVDLALVKGRPVHVTLLIGQKQTRLDTSLSLQLNEFANQVCPVRVDASGRNALDMILACHLGRSVEQHPGARFTVVSKDKDFTPVLEHLQAQGFTVARCDAFAAAFPSPPKAPASSKPTSPAKPAKKDRLDKFIAHLRNSPPSNRTKLEHMIEAYFKPSLPQGGMKGIIAELVKRKVIGSEAKAADPGSGIDRNNRSNVRNNRTS